MKTSKKGNATENLILKSLLGKPLHINTRLYCYSSRSRTTRSIGNPRVLSISDDMVREYGNSGPYLKRLLNVEPDTDSDFTDSATVELQEGTNPADRIPFEEYDYGSDSDLDEDNDDEDEVKMVPEKCEELNGLVDHTSTRRILVKDAAFRTWRALLFYLYTGHCSPKSLYRLAQKVGIEALADHALRELKQLLTSNNVIHELTLVLPTKYPPVLQAELDVLFSNIDSPAVETALPTFFARIAQGNFPEGPGAAIMTGLYKRVLNKHYPGRKAGIQKRYTKPSGPSRKYPHYVSDSSDDPILPTFKN